MFFNGFQQREVQFVRGNSQHGAHSFGVHVVPGERISLIKKRQSVPHGTVRFFRDHLQSFQIGRNAFLLADIMQASHNLLGGQAFEIKPLHTREDGLRDLIHFCRSKNKDDVRRRLFQCFQQGVESSL